MYGVCEECAYSSFVDGCKCLVCQCKQSCWYERFVTKDMHCEAWVSEWEDLVND